MKIRFDNDSSKKTIAYITHNGQVQELVAGGALKLKVQRGDTVTFRIGKFSKTHEIKFQSPDVTFELRPNRALVYAYMIFLVAVVAGVWYFKYLSNTLVTVLVIVALVLFETLTYFNGYRAIPVHH